MKEAVSASVEATDRSIPPVMITKTIVSIISPISTESREARMRLSQLRKKGERVELMAASRIISRTSIHSQRSNALAPERRAKGRAAVVTMPIISSAVIGSPHSRRNAPMAVPMVAAKVINASPSGCAAMKNSLITGSYSMSRAERLRMARSTMTASRISRP